MEDETEIALRQAMVSVRIKTPETETLNLLSLSGESQSRADRLDKGICNSWFTYKTFCMETCQPCLVSQRDGV
ncbi:hypothetical protein BDV33DRAFT_185400 [Aspergillus novoparasiticus]|uniref:Uncharacterized protein n=1 Tax=Aspergillus novoparasiticus TaxID=986946 RepID=A0A5N6E7N0_9EURO|nr:hypothetical protein BDV33DRAFT_185400 [Aspergillus novoparasiticus]